MWRNEEQALVGNIQFRPPFCTFNAPFASSLRKKLYLCTRNYKIHSVMTETKKDFKDWDISDFKDFTDMGGMQKFEESRSHRPFFGFNKQPKGTPHRPYKNYPTSNLADVL